ncbi:nucleotidyltransferase family protein [Proteiniborus sp.]|uniref:nucleotidyltransferase family protein n=1 Tax=Proteiniborus sp. TaxID=2079015 RepID=UPI00332902C6
MINCVILAGNEDSQLAEKSSKAFIELQGKPMIMYVIDALKASNKVDKIAVVGDKSQLGSLSIHVNTIIDHKGSILDNIAAGARYFKEDDMLLISTCDIPLLTGEAVADFITRALVSKADICYPIINKTTCDLAYPESKRTYATLKEGQFTGGNLFMVNPTIIDRSLYIAEQMISYRKSPAKMSRVLGLPFLIKLATGRLSIEEVENRVSKLLNIRGKAIISKYAEIGNDVDRLEHVQVIERYMQKNTRCIL